MRDPEIVLRQVQELYDGLGEYYRLLDPDFANPEAEALRARLNILYGEVRPDLQELPIARDYEVSGRTFPALETALSPFDPDTSSVTLQGVEMARTCLEWALGILRRRVSGEELVVKLGDQPKPRRWPAFCSRSKAALALFGGAVALVLVDLLVSLASADGLRGILLHPEQTTGFLVAALIIAIIGAIVATGGRRDNNRH